MKRFFKKINKTTNKKVMGAVQVSKNGIDFRSKLELYCYEQLVKYKLPFEYEKKKYVLIGASKNKFDLYVSRKVRGKSYKQLVKSSPKNQAMTYTPDFLVYHKGVVYIIETKGFETDTFKAKIKLFKRLLNELCEKNKYVLMIPKSQSQVNECIKIILEQ